MRGLVQSLLMDEVKPRLVDEVEPDVSLTPVDVGELSWLWWLQLSLGLLSGATGVIVLLKPGDSLKALAVVTGIDAELIRRHVPERQYPRLKFFVCGSRANDGRDREPAALDGRPREPTEHQALQLRLGASIMLRTEWVSRLVLIIATLLLIACVIFAVLR